MGVPLRTRLALWYALISMLTVLIVGGISSALALQAMENQFETRLQEQADVISEAFNDPSKAFGQPNVHSEAGIQVQDATGKVVSSSGALTLLSSPVQNEHLVLQQKPFRLVKRNWVRFDQVIGSIWVALPEEPLISGRKTVVLTVTVGALISALLTFSVGLFLGRLNLIPLERAARHANSLTPDQQVLIPYQGHKDEVFQLVSAINGLLERTWSQQAFEKQFVGQVAHELGAPLTSLRGYAERLQEQRPSPDLQKIIGVARDLQFTAHDLIQYARGRTEMELVLHFVPARELRVKLERLVEGVHYTGIWNSTYLMADIDRLAQALRNLFTNAKRVVGTTGHIECELVMQGNETVFYTRDNGPGIAPEHLPHLFEPFYSGSGSYGLGLSVARKVAEQHGGQLTVRNRPEGGAEFKLSIPLPEEDTSDLEEELEEETPASGP
ncbi:sensor histidine kinase [Deinococcus cellulosilyticus]|uniref:histidine kinase n=1 Tax=Deinococcus cellulosilyticus (strain DSM 18568 / NBRC 106333 / KACC 11606 / 5516J-15) TaxID=1223518 RepID=A0A511MWK6_DEIC1|nr:HAMP domain-containing sensor histidine kinase [Deinococcus cellulosilyticus]GEM44964.1 two-component sensor histidine kinase [Deinococcus cellulosilyticus NBRC 106333 = KACC 11606]